MAFALRHAAWGLGLALTGLAHAQSYTATLLTPPTNTDYCSYATSGVLGANGDVTVNCNLRTLSIFGAPVGSGRAVVWRGGLATPKTLGGTLLLPQSTEAGMQADGTVLGYVFGTGSSATLSAWKGTTRSNYALPSGYSGWEVDRTSPDGQTLLIFKRNDGSAYGRSFALVKAGAVRLVAAPPPACGSLNATSEKPGWAINNVGQMALTRTQQLYSGTGTDRIGTLCLWDGQQWQVSPRTPAFIQPDGFSGDDYDMALRGLNDQGEVLADRNVVRFTWQPAAGFRQVDPRAWVFTATGELAGGASVTATNYATKAVLWRNGQAIELSQAATAPAGYQLSTVLSTNAKGQVLVLAQATGSPVASVLASRLVLLTPR